MRSSISELSAKAVTLKPATLARAQEAVAARARALGFDVCRFASVAEGWEAGERLDAFVEAGRHGQMAWMQTTRDRRRHPCAMWEDARSAVVLGMNYGPTSDPLALLARPERAAISVYARGDDYHEVIKGRLKEVAQVLAARTGAEVKVFVDTAPLMEKPLAGKAGVGWQGKHTNLVSRDYGSWLFLGVILSAAELVPDEPEVDHCGSCTACLDVCPTRAFPAPFQLDARRCISYLTIEHDGPWAPEFREAVGNRIYGCDDCLAVCPWNKFARDAREARLAERDDLKAPPLAELARLDDAAFRARFVRSPIKRIGRERFIRNVLYSIGSGRVTAALPEVEALLDDASGQVRGAAAWALSRLDPARFAALAERRLTAEPDPAVRAEWEAAA
ncbi:tRNA epoxyqueuosine(34) reductase QueG [Brevundimonas sp. 2R-24]|uniref:tRNA epoxyqueuosine(34) reductase QueG n=1 Tax=Peiella sedimenti TaxID=3061083 RepID=A0ABT8SJA5_9CAUL|nr:tRNA epoxyqueuosine(34) reductase QueG [Caulobacteraceae bacterium XZ-24]